MDDAAVAGCDVTDNVVELVTGKIRRLGPAAQRLLQLAACVGYRFSWRTLAAIADDPEAGAALGELVREGLVVPLAGGAEGEEQLRFLHDRVQQAADSLLTAEARTAAHLRIGRLLRDRHAAEVPDEALFEVVGHLDVALAQIAGEEREALARLNLRAGRRARAAAAYHAARQYFQAGSECLPADAWSHDYALTFALRVELAESTHLCGAFVEADALFAEALAHARSRGERAQVYIGGSCCTRRWATSRAWWQRPARRWRCTGWRCRTTGRRCRRRSGPRSRRRRPTSASDRSRRCSTPRRCAIPTWRW
ncbi:hypothetical protein OV079_50240 [Nannocystis pusilla]|uniref:Uncharacterized protein n=1 Tax=Nannocystis pusilla TaxID=889268 RepID=A0A9X3F031_9BACT|nr:hypothetical protein [Nannocystis pusilla]